MADTFVPAMFGPPDLEGFRTVSFYGGEGSEILRLSLHIERFRQHFTRTADLKEYSDAEQEGLSTASVIAAARKQSSLHDPDLVLAGILDLLIPKFVTEQTEKHFPTLAWIALQTVSDACVKYGIRGVLESMQAPRIYGEEAAELITRTLTETIRTEFLGIEAGRPAKVRQQLADTREALKRIREKKKLGQGKKPTQQQVAEELGIGVRALRNWPRTCNLTWDECVTASQWKRVEKAEIPAEWLTAVRRFENAAKAEAN